jgi:hypothetical protein
MHRSQLPELHYIAATANLASILQHGILCNRKAKLLKPVSIAMTEIQDIRARKTVPGGLALHDYANLYMCARNPMLFKRRALHQDLSVVRVDTHVLDLAGVVITDGNAASNYCAFLPSPSGLSRIDYGLVFAESWIDPDLIQYYRKKNAKCAEVLVPQNVSSIYLLGVYVSGDQSAAAVRAVTQDIDVVVDSHLFFR